VVVADASNERVRVVAAKTGTFYGQAMTAGHIYTIAGDGTGGFSGDGGPATSAELQSPAGTTVDGPGNVVVADAGNERVRVVAAKTGTFYGQAMTAGHIYTVAGNGTGGFSGDGGPATSAKLADPDGVAVDGSGNLLIADSANQRVRVLAASPGRFYGQAMTAQDIYTVAGNGLASLSGDGGPATKAQMALAYSVAVDAAGDMVIADPASDRVRIVAARTGTLYGRAVTAGDIYTVAGNGSDGFSGDGGLATRAALSGPTAVAVDGAGNLIIADTYNERVRVVAAMTGTFYGQAMTAGHIYTVAGNGTGGFSGDGGPATSAELWTLQGVIVDGAGNLIIADSSNERIRVAAARTGRFYGQAMTAGHIYTIAGNGTQGFSGDGGPATSAEFTGPTGLAVDPAGNLVIADGANSRVRAVAVKTGTFYGQAMTAGHIYTIAGDGFSGFAGDGVPAIDTDLNSPSAVVVDRSGNVVIADGGNSRVRVVAVKTGTFYGQAMTAGDIYTIAGDYVHGYFGDGGPGTSAELYFPEGVAVDVSGNVLIGDTDNGRVRIVTG
jgi:hypothetical protein